MASEPISGERLLGYLLGELPSHELAEIDRRLLEDDEFADALGEARDDLLDAYALGALAPEQRDRVHRALGLTGERDARLEFSRALHEALRSPPPSGAREAPPGTDRSSPARRAGYWALPVAACLALGAGLWLTRGAHLGNGPSPAVAAGPHFVLLLSPEVLRGEGPERRVSMPRDAAALDVQIVVPDEAMRYDVQVSSPSGHSTYANLVPRSTSGLSYVELSMPRAQLRSLSYEFILLRAQRTSDRPLERYVVHIALS